MDLVAGAFDVEQLVVFVAADRALTEVCSRKRVGIGDDRAAKDVFEELDVGFFGTTDGENSLFGEIVLGEVVNSLLTEDDIRAALDDLLYFLFELGFLFVEELLELVGRLDRNLGVDISLFAFKVFLRLTNTFRPESNR